MTRNELVEENEKVGMVIVNACNSWKEGFVSTETFKMIIRDAVKKLPPFYWNEDEEVVEEMSEWAKECTEEYQNEVLDTIGSDNDDLIYAPSSGCFLCCFIDEKAAYNIMHELKKI